MLGLLISLLIIGSIAGAVARLLIPGRQEIGIVTTIAVGVVGSFVGGLFGYLLLQKDPNQGWFQPSGIIGSITGAVILLLIYIHLGQRYTVQR